MFALKGYAAASMDDVCLRSGMSKGGLYHHFPTKPALLVAAVEALAGTGMLMPPLGRSDAASMPGRDALARLLIEVWAEASREGDLGVRLRQIYAAAAPGSVDQVVAQLLAIGALVQQFTRDEADVAAATPSSGVDQAA